MTTEHNEPKRWQFPLKSLFVVILVAAVVTNAVKLAGLIIVAIYLLIGSIWLAFAVWLNRAHDAHGRRS